MALEEKELNPLIPARQPDPHDDQARPLGSKERRAYYQAGPINVGLRYLTEPVAICASVDALAATNVMMVQEEKSGFHQSH